MNAQSPKRLNQIAEKRRQKGWTQDQLADAVEPYLGKRPTTMTIGRWERDEGLLIQTLKALALALDCPMAELLAPGEQGLPQADLRPAAANENAISVPEYDVRASAGGGALNGDEAVVDYWMFSEGQLDSMGLLGADIGIIKVVGDSMFPTLVSNSWLLVNLSDKSISTPGIFVVWDGAGLVVKRVEREFASKPAKVKIKSDNPLHDAYSVREEELVVAGRAAFEIRRL